MTEAGAHSASARSGVARPGVAKPAVAGLAVGDSGGRASAVREFDYRDPSLPPFLSGSNGPAHGQQAGRAATESGPGSGPSSGPDSGPGTGPGMKSSGELDQARAQVKLLLEEAEQRGYARGLVEARAESRGHAEALQKLLEGATQALEQAARTYLERLEADVVGLSLEIARKILHHEAQLDRFFLLGAVRSSIAQLHQGAPVVLHTAPADRSEWEALLKRVPALPSHITFASDADLAPGTCRIAVGASTLEISVEAQLGEIARRFQQLLAVDHDCAPTGPGAACGPMPAAGSAFAASLPAAAIPPDPAWPAAAQPPPAPREPARPSPAAEVPARGLSGGRPG